MKFFDRINATQHLRLIIFISLMGLPIAAWLDLEGLSSRILVDQAQGTRQIIDVTRDLYAKEVVSKVLTATEKIIPSHTKK